MIVRRTVSNQDCHNSTTSHQLGNDSELTIATFRDDHFRYECAIGLPSLISKYQWDDAGGMSVYLTHRDRCKGTRRC